MPPHGAALYCLMPCFSSLCSWFPHLFLLTPASLPPLRALALVPWLLPLFVLLPLSPCEAYGFSFRHAALLFV